MKKATLTPNEKKLVHEIFEYIYEGLERLTPCKICDRIVACEYKEFLQKRDVRLFQKEFDIESIYKQVTQELFNRYAPRYHEKLPKFNGTMEEVSKLFKQAV